jgi:hypothetical protein
LTGFRYPRDASLKIAARRPSRRLSRPISKAGPRNPSASQAGRLAGRPATRLHGLRPGASPLHRREQARRLAVLGSRTSLWGRRPVASRRGAGGSGAGSRSWHAAIGFRGGIWAIGRRRDRTSQALADAGRRMQPAAGRTRRRHRPLARAGLGQRVQHCPQARSRRRASSSRAPGGRCVGWAGRSGAFLRAIAHSPRPC